MRMEMPGGLEEWSGFGSRRRQVGLGSVGLGRSLHLSGRPCPPRPEGATLPLLQANYQRTGLPTTR